MDVRSALSWFGVAAVVGATGAIAVVSVIGDQIPPFAWTTPGLGAPAPDPAPLGSPVPDAPGAPTVWVGPVAQRATRAPGPVPERAAPPAGRVEPLRASGDRPDSPAGTEDAASPRRDRDRAPRDDAERSDNGGSRRDGGDAGGPDRADADPRGSDDERGDRNDGGRSSGRGSEGRESGGSEGRGSGGSEGRVNGRG